MFRQYLLIALVLSLILPFPLEECYGRGRGGGGRGGGFSSGGGRSAGGSSRSATQGRSGGYGGGARSAQGGGFGGRGTGPSQSNMSRGGQSSAGLGGGGFSGAQQRGQGFGGAGAPGRSGARAGGSGARGAGVQGMGGNRFSSPSRSQLNSFLGLPSDGGMPHSGSLGVGAGNVGVGTQLGVGGGRPGAGATRNRAGSLGVGAGDVGVGSDLGIGGGRPGAETSARSSTSQLPTGDKFDVNYGTAEGSRGGQAAGITVTGPQGNTAGRVVGAGPQGGVGTVGGVQGAGGGTAARGVAVKPGGQAAVVGGIRGPGGYGAARGVAVGPGGAAAGFARVTPSGRYTTATAVRSSYRHWGVYGRGWYARYPGAWFAAGWATGAVWRTCTWGSAAAYCGYSDTPPVYYDYGNNVTYEDDSVYVYGENAGTTQEYCQQASDIASAGAAAEAPADGDWLPLGVFALTKPDQKTSDVSIQLALNKQGIIRGNYTDNATNKNQAIQGSVDKQSQRVAFTVGEDKTNVIETGLYNLTKDEAPCLIHFGKDQTEQWLLVRLQKPETANN